VTFPVKKNDPRFPLKEAVDDPFPQELFQCLQIGDVCREDKGQHCLVTLIEDLVEDHPLRLRAELNAYFVDDQQVDCAHSRNDLALRDFRIPVERILDFSQKPGRLGEECRVPGADDLIDDGGAEMALPCADVAHEEEPGAGLPVHGEVIGETFDDGEGAELSLPALSVGMKIIEGLTDEPFLEHAVPEEGIHPVLGRNFFPFRLLPDEAQALAGCAGKPGPMGRSPGDPQV